MSQLTATVAIPTYRRPAPLERALRSLHDQDRPPDEVIVVAWAGDSESLRLARRLGADWPCLRVLCTEVNTITAKENLAITQATGDVLCFLDDDAAARRGWLSGLLAHYSDPHVVGVGGRDVVWLGGVPYESDARVVGRISWFGRVMANHHQRTVGARDVAFLKGCNMSFRRELLGPIDERLRGDVPYAFEIDMGLAAGRRGRIVYDPAVLVDHYPSSDMNAHRAPLARVLSHNQTYVLLKHFSWPKRLAFVAYTFLVGDRDTVGAVRLVLAVGDRNWSPDVARAHFQGKLAGVQSFLAWRRGS